MTGEKYLLFRIFGFRRYFTMDDKCGFVIRFLQFLPLSHPPQIETMLVLFKKKSPVYSVIGVDDGNSRTV